MAAPTLPLLGGYNIPIVGYGTAGKASEVLAAALETALEYGYRHIDTAFGYQNEELIGQVLQKWLSSGKLKRDDLFIVTKLPSLANTPERVEQYLKMSLDRLQLDYVDLYLIHFPVWIDNRDPTVAFGGEKFARPTDHVALWKKMEEQVDAGRAKTIGLSNFNIKQIDRILKIARIKPASLQVQVHVYLQEKELVKFAQDNGIAVVAYSPLGAPGRGQKGDQREIHDLINNPVVTKISKKYSRSPGQILLKFLVQQNIVVIPASKSPARIKENISLFDFTLGEEDLNVLRGLHLGEKARLGLGHYGPDVKENPEWPWPKLS